MKQFLKKEYQKNILMNTLTLDPVLLTEAFFHNVTRQPFILNVPLKTIHHQSVSSDFYLHFQWVVVPCGDSVRAFYQGLPARMRQEVLKAWSGYETTYPLYFYQEFKDNASSGSLAGSDRTFLLGYLAPMPPSKVWSFSALGCHTRSSQELLMEKVLKIMVQSTLWDQADQEGLNPCDLFEGSFFLNPLTQQSRQQKNYLNGFFWTLFLKDQCLSWTLKNKHFEWDPSKTPAALHDDWIHIQQPSLVREEDARKHARVFLSFENGQKLSQSRWFTQLNFYQILRTTLERFRLPYQEQSFHPTMLFTDFKRCPIALPRIHVWVQESDLQAYDKEAQRRGYSDGLMALLLNIQDWFQLDLSVHMNPSVDKLLQQGPGVHWMLQWQPDDKDLVIETLPQKTRTWSSVMEPFIQRQLERLSLSEFLQAIQFFDLYSQVKLYHVYAHCHDLERLVTQGWVIDEVYRTRCIDSTFVFPLNQPISEPHSESVSPDHDPSEHQKVLRSIKTLKILVKKMLTELRLKHDLWMEPFLTLKTPSMDTYPLSSLIMVQKKNVNRQKVFAVAELLRYSPWSSPSMNPPSEDCSHPKPMKASNTSPLPSCSNSTSNSEPSVLPFQETDWIAQPSRIFVSKLPDDLMLLNLDQELEGYSQLILLNQEYMIKIKDNQRMPFLILEKDHWTLPEKNPLTLVQHLQRQRQDLKQFKPTRSGQLERNLFFPYVRPSVAHLKSSSSRSDKGYSVCLIEERGHQAWLFMGKSNEGALRELEKNSRLDLLELHQWKGYRWEPVDWSLHPECLNFYLHTLTFDALSLQGLAKKSLLTKYVDLTLFN